ncbi:MAG: hypothetical protein WBC51_01640 [Vicinamibacterales bacterium]
MVNRSSRVDQPVVLGFRQVAQAGVIVIEELDSTNGIGYRQTPADAPVEERLQDGQVFVDRAMGDLLRAAELHILDLRG